MEGHGGAPVTRQHKPSAVFSPSSSVPKQRNHSETTLHLDSAKMGTPVQQFTPNLSPENTQNCRRPGIPSPRPHLPSSASRSGPQQLRAQNFRSAPSHTRSLSQPCVFSLDCLLPLAPSPYHELGSTSLSDPTSLDVSKEELDTGSTVSPSWGVETAPPSGAHKRSNSDIPFGFSTVIHSSPQRNLDSLKPGRTSSRIGGSVQSARQELYHEGDEGKSEREAVEDLFTTFMNLDNINSLNSCGIVDMDFDSKTSGPKPNGGGNGGTEVKISGNGNPNCAQREAKEREGDNVASMARHLRSVSMDSFMSNMHFGNESPKPPPSPETQLAQKIQVNSLDDNFAKFRLGFGNGEFTAVEMEKIMANERLAEIASSDPKRAKRILANRQSAARSKERKMRYISELEHKVQTLQTEATTLSTQVTMLQRDTSEVTSQNNELKFRIQAMEQQAQLKDALNQALKVEVQRLRLAAAGLNRDSQGPSRTADTASRESSSDAPTTGSTASADASGSRWQRR